ncbi:hypothetical protein ACS0TY_008119 [Phlomoides rotata]
MSGKWKRLLEIAGNLCITETKHCLPRADLGFGAVKKISSSRVLEEKDLLYPAELYRMMDAYACTLHRDLPTSVFQHYK